MKEAGYIGVVAGIVAALIFGAVSFVKTANARWDRNERAFRQECEAVNGKAVWNNKYWECLK